MPLLRCDYTASGEIAGWPEACRVAARSLSRSPIIVMTHGLRYSPGAGPRCPHRRLLSLTPEPGFARAFSWPRALGVPRRRPRPGEPVCIALGWPARGPLWQVARRADAAGAALGRHLGALAEAAGRPVHLFAHSLGARLVLGAVAAAPSGAAGRAILLSAAALRRSARDALAAGSGTGGGTEIVNVTSLGNRLFDMALEIAFAAPGQSLGRGLGRDHPRWLDLPIDMPGTCAALDRLGFPQQRMSRLVSHWGCYLQPGTFALYRHLLGRAAPPLEPLRRALRDLHAERARPSLEANPQEPRHDFADRSLLLAHPEWLENLYRPRGDGSAL
ncbi:hypothetical protein [Profundibacterium mesophilum]|uniref:Alpha/beta hydrolase n=1 Tax=Profundibacterium mesophilum KAUST100406-0324 TaxID=1037889 RepID=A0A921TCV5_9RHOB|nr:hypothetical protein [Profundibacterium mesophilum]KAF0676123.1 uncharacterized protein PMES_01442 [Profundibacterium mesophilum KAUST100406-0324]